MTGSSGIARLKIALDDVKPAVARRVEVPLAIGLDRLHLVLQAAMGWTNSHLYEIRARGVGWGAPGPDWGDGPLDARKARLLDLLEDTGAKTLRYLYDFGDAWEHAVKVERTAHPMPGLVYPLLVDATGRCPPEDVGGPWGYAGFLEAIGDPEHESHAEMVQWAGAPFDPNTVDFDEHAKGRRSPRQGMVAQASHQAQTGNLIRNPRRTATLTEPQPRPEVASAANPLPSATRGPRRMDTAKTQAPLLVERSASPLRSPSAVYAFTRVQTVHFNERG